METLEKVDAGSFVIEAATTLKRADRCDKARCGAQARVRAWFLLEDESGDMSEKFVDLCGHHYRNAESGIMTTSTLVRIEDGRSSIK